MPVSKKKKSKLKVTKKVLVFRNEELELTTPKNNKIRKKDLLSDKDLRAAINLLDNPDRPKKKSKIKKIIKRITSWSYTRYSTYQQCPLKAKLKFIDKIKEPASAPMLRGSDIHKMAESYIKGKLKRMPRELKLVEDDLKYLKKRLKKKTLLTAIEDSWAFTKEWAQTVWNDWANCWVRIKLDVCWEAEKEDGVLIIVDWKTGKFWKDQNDKYTEQLELYALAGFLMYDHIEQIRPYLNYVDIGRLFPDPDEGDDEMIFYRKDLPGLIKTWEQRVKPMLSDTKFAPRPNRWCGYCHFRASNKANGGGQCKY